jgi:hypothetical protein
MVWSVHRESGTVHVDLRQIENTEWEPLLNAVESSMAEAPTSLVVIRVLSADERSHRTKLVESLTKMIAPETVKVRVVYARGS